MGAFLQGNELLLILAVLLLILGPSKLPALARGLGQAIREFKKASQGLYDEEKKEKATPPPAKQDNSKRPIDDDTLMKLAEKLGVSTENKTRDEIAEEVVTRAKEKGLLE